MENNFINVLIKVGATYDYPSLVLVRPRKTRPCLAERLLMGRKESNHKKSSIRFPTMRYVRTAKAQTSMCIRAV